MLSVILDGLELALDPGALLAGAIGVLLGIFFGALPGLTSTMGVALLIPLTFTLDPIVALSAILGLYVSGVYAGSLTATLIGTPGTAAAAATLLEGPQMRDKGETRKALSMTTIASFIGGLFSCIVLILVAPQLAKVALSFGPPEYFALGFFGISIVAGISSDSLLKGVIAALIGLWISTIGLDPNTGVPRMTFGSTNLLNGIELVPALVGLFAISEVLQRLEKIMDPKKGKIKINKIGVRFNELRENAFNFLRSSVIGTFIGIIPATGSGIASFVAYNESKRFAKDKERYGTGHLPGLVATETANNAVTGGALVPLLTLGIPGDVITAVILGALMMQGLTPGPELFAKNSDIVSGLFITLVIVNFFLLLIGLLAIKLFPYLLKIKEGLLMPVIVSLCIIGSYAINNSTFDVIITLVFGLLGYALIKGGFPLAPLLLALILAPIIEKNFRNSMVMSEQSLSIFFTRPISLVFILITFAVFASIIYKGIKSVKANQT